MSMKHVLLGFLFLIAFCWVSFMGLIGVVSGSVASQGVRPASLGEFTDDGSLKAEITSIHRQGFKITVTVRVTDKSDKIVGGLTEREFEVLENGRPVQFSSFTGAGQAPVRVCLVLDYSNSMKGQKIAEAKKAALALLAMLRDHTDHLGLYFFNGTLAKTNSQELLAMGPLDPGRREQARKAIEETPLNSGTPMYDAMEKAFARMEGESGRRIMVVMGDGLDTQYRGARAEEMMHKLGEIAVRQGVPVYMVSLMGGKSDQDGMKKMADLGKGRHFHAPQPSDLEGIYRQIGQTLQNEYVLEYTSPRPVEDGSNRQVVVALKQGTVGTKTSSSYHVPGMIATGGTTRAFEEGQPVADVSQPFLSVLLPLGLLLGVLFGVPYYRWLQPSTVPDAQAEAAITAAAAAPPNVRKR